MNWVEEFKAHVEQVSIEMVQNDRLDVWPVTCFPGTRFSLHSKYHQELLLDSSQYTGQSQENYEWQMFFSFEIRYFVRVVLRKQNLMQIT